MADAIVGELASQRRQLKLIASENYASPAVLLAMGNWLSDKYAEGTPGHRMYAGCEMVDRVETLAADHATALFGADHAYVQPHSGIDANLVAYWAILAHRVESPALAEVGAKHVNDLEPAVWERLRQDLHDQRMMGMSLDAGGHLTHGFRPNISGKLFNQASYGVDPESELLDYGAIAAQAREFRPLVLVAGYSAYPRNPNFATLAEIAAEVGATFMVDMAHFAGLVAGKVLTGDLNPVRHAQVVTSTTHKSLRGPRGGLVLCTEEYAPDVDRGCPMVLGGPLPHVMAAKAVALAEARQDSFAGYAARIVDNARALADGLLRRGVAAGHRRDRQPPRAHERGRELRPHRAPGRAGAAGRRAWSPTATRCPADPNGAWYTSGVRLGTPALTTLGFGPDELDEVADVIVTALRATTPATSTAKAKYDLDAATAEACREPLRRPAGPAPPVSRRSSCDDRRAVGMPGEVTPAADEIPRRAGRSGPAAAATRLEAAVSPPLSAGTIRK